MRRRDVEECKRIRICLNLPSRIVNYTPEQGKVREKRGKNKKKER